MKYIHCTQTRTFQITFQKLWFCIPFIHSGFTYICNMNKFIWYVTHSSSSKTVTWQKGRRHLLQKVHILFNYMKTFLHAVFLLPTMYNPWIERNGCVLLCGMQTVLLWLISYNFFGKIRLTFLLHHLVSAAVVSFLDMLQYIATNFMLHWKLWLTNGEQHFSHLLIFL
jgi:hypothetical protein